MGLEQGLTLLLLLLLILLLLLLLMLRYGLGAGVNRVFSCCPGTLAGHTSRSSALLSAQYTEVLPTKAILNHFSELWMSKFTIAENSRGVGHGMVFQLETIEEILQNTQKSYQPRQS